MQFWVSKFLSEVNQCLRTKFVLRFLFILWFLMFTLYYYYLSTPFGLQLEISSPILDFYQIQSLVSLLYLFPDICIALTCLAVLSFITIINFNKLHVDLWKQKYFAYFLVTIIRKIICFVIILYIWWFLFRISDGTNNLFYDYVSFDFYTLTFKILILSTGLFILTNSVSYIIAHTRNCIEYVFLIFLTLYFLISLVGAASLLLMFVCIIGFSLNMYVLIMYDAPRQSSLEAASKYFFLSALSSGLLASGLVLAYLWLYWNQFWLITLILHWMSNDIGNEWDIGLGKIVLFSIIYGFLFKLAIFPCHLWVPEVYDGSPNLVMGIFVLPVKIAMFAVFIKLLVCVFRDVYMLWSWIIWFSAILSMIWGCLCAYSEDKIKKFISYSSINQLGFLLIGVTCGSFEGLRATIIYLFIYIIMNWGFLLIYFNTFNNQNYKNIEFLTELKYFGSNNWIYSVGFAIILFSMAGIPPLAGFFGKYLLFLAAFQEEYYLLVGVGMITSLISAFYYLRIIKIMFFESIFDKGNSFNSLWLTLRLSSIERQIYFIIQILIIFFVFGTQWLFSIVNFMIISCQIY